MRLDSIEISGFQLPEDCRTGLSTNEWFGPATLPEKWVQEIYRWQNELASKWVTLKTSRGIWFHKKLYFKEK